MKIKRGTFTTPEPMPIAVSGEDNRAILSILRRQFGRFLNAGAPSQPRRL